MVRFFRTVLLVSTVVCAPAVGQAAELTLAWDPPADGVTTGYILFIGTAPRTYSSQVNIGNVSTYRVTGLADGTTYYFSLKAYDAKGALSEFSAEVSETTSSPADTVRPTVSLVYPLHGGTVSGTFDIRAFATDNVGVVGVRFQIDGQDFGPEDVIPPYSVTWNSALVGNGAHVITAIARDAASNVAAASVTVTVSNPTGIEGYSLVTTQVPAGQNYRDGSVYELGVRVVSSTAGQIRALRYYKGTAETGTHVGRVWSATGQLLASVAFSNETSSGWQQQTLPTPLAIQANTEYLVSVTTGPDGNYVATVGFFNSPLVSGPLTAPLPNGRFASAGTYPQNTYAGTHYFRDLVFVPSSTTPDTTRPTVSITSPSSSSTVSGQITIRATAIDNIGVAGVKFQIDGQDVGTDDTSAPFEIAWDTASVSNGSRLITAIARDAAGNTAEASIEVSVFNDPTAGVVATPTITPAGGSFSAPQLVTIHTTTSGASIRYTTDGTSPTAGSTLYSDPFTVSSSTTVNARAFASGMTDSDVASATFTITPVGSGTSASFVHVDTTTAGNWIGTYGTQGYAIVNDATSLPDYAQVTTANPAPYTWSDAPADPRALQRASGIGRRAATWYHSQSFSITLRLTDGQRHRIALYAVDWDRLGRQQRIEVRDAVSGAVLDTRTLASFGGGQYLVWEVTGQITIHVTRLGVTNAVVSAVFIDPVGGAPPPQPTVATPTISPAGGSFSGPQSVTIATATTGASIRYTTDGSTPTSTSWPYAGPFTVSASTTVKARAFATGMTDSAVATATLTFAPAGSGTSATFGQTDTTTAGTWIGTYGTLGHSLVNDATTFPAFAQVTLAQPAPYTWSVATTDVRALQRTAGGWRLAATWYHPQTFTVSVRLTDGQPRRVALYMVDWDRLGRQQRIDVRDAATGALLDTRTVSNFGGGQYMVWQVTGQVTITFSAVAGPNAILSAIFID